MRSAKNETPNLTVLETLEKLQFAAERIREKNHLSLEEMAYSAALATAFIVKECQNDLPMESGFQTAVYGFIEGSKTCPPKMDNPQPKKGGFFKFWN